MRRNLPMIYIIEDNGVYGLTKGQFSATADLGSKLKTGVINDLPPYRYLRAGDRCWARPSWPFVLRRQEAAAGHVKGGIAHRGTVMLDVLFLYEGSPGTASRSRFNEGSPI
jgi:2-oxoglutarate ferredoxin oxidoreductase subunit beta